MTIGGSGSRAVWGEMVSGSGLLGRRLVARWHCSVRPGGQKSHDPVAALSHIVSSLVRHLLPTSGAQKKSRGFFFFVVLRTCVVIQWAAGRRLEFWQWLTRMALI